MDKLLTIAETANILNVSKWTLRNWDDSDKLKAIRTEGGHRRYLESEVQQFMGKEYIENEITEKVAVYCRVSSNGQKQSGDLERQKGRLLEYCIKKKYNVEYIIKQPYSIECKECGSELTVARKDVDSDGDLKLEISPCEKCCKKE